jgi:hypothetical protein
MRATGEISFEAGFQLRRRIGFCNAKRVESLRQCLLGEFGLCDGRIAQKSRSA